MKKFCFICCMLLLIALLLAGCIKQDMATTNTPINQNLLQVKNFNISTDLATDNTSAVGDIYFQKSADHITVTILASINIGANDWGGVSFYIPKGWEISKFYPATLMTIWQARKVKLLYGVLKMQITSGIVISKLATTIINNLQEGVKVRCFWSW